MANAHSAGRDACRYTSDKLLASTAQQRHTRPDNMIGLLREVCASRVARWPERELAQAGGIKTPPSHIG